MTEIPLRDFLLSTERTIAKGPGTEALKVEFAERTRRRARRAIARFQWLVLAFFTVIAVDSWRLGPSWRVAGAWLLLALLAVFGPAIGERRLARRPLRVQVRFAGQTEACVVLMLVTMPLLGLGLLPRAAAIEIPTTWLIATCAITVPALALLYHRLARTLARRFDPEWWE